MKTDCRSTCVPKFFLAAMVGLGALGGFALPAEAGYTIDQQYRSNLQSEVVGSFGSSVSYYSPFGQTFTAGLGSINFATFVIGNASNNAGSIAVQVRSGPAGTLLGTSDTFAYPSYYGGLDGTRTEFDFTQAVALTPGSTYALELVQLDSASNILAFGDQAGTYGGGTEFGTGRDFTGDDLYFSEGVRTVSSSVPEPGSIALIGGGLWAAARGRRKRAPVASRACRPSIRCRAAPPLQV